MSDTKTDKKQPLTPKEIAEQLDREDFEGDDNHMTTPEQFREVLLREIRKRRDERRAAEGLPPLDDPNVEILDG